MPALSQFNGDEIFLDANILIYHLTSHPQFGAACHQLLQNTEVGIVNSYTSNWVLAEVIHKLMILETCDRFRLQNHEAINYLKKNHHAINRLSKYRKALDLIYRLSNLTILEVNDVIFRQSHAYISKYHLLSSDAVHVATGLTNNIRNMATNDKDFKRVKDLTIWAP